MTTPMLTEALDTAVRARATLLVAAQHVLPGVRLDTLTDREIHEAALTKIYGAEFDVAGESDAYVAGAFAHAIKRGLADERSDARPPTRRVRRADDTPQLAPWRRPLSVSRDRPLTAAERRLPMWQMPLSYTKSRVLDER